ncbi:MAG TPA: hypothetical protein DHW02_04510 [Ktedonobacter sp.]|nr:hypothetical protein [Ktedonobacter sp.]
MSIESISQELDSQDTLEITQLAVKIVHDRYPQTKQQREQTIAPTDVHTAHYDLSVVIPTRNEHDNISPLLEALLSALNDLYVEVIFVDDSDDDTPQIITGKMKTMNSSSFHITLEHRAKGEAREGGLATAVVHGLQVAQAPYVAVLDADLQHPPEQLHLFYEQALIRDADLVLASRYIKGGSYQGLDGVGRRFISIGMKWTAKLLFPERLHNISDPLGGFFLLRRSLLTDVMLRPIGYKILLEILIRTPWKQALEVPYHFQARSHGQSKATMRQGTLALQHMLRLFCGVPAAGRVWKIGLLLCLNMLITLMLIAIDRVFPDNAFSISTVVSGIAACVDFMLFNRFIFPSPVVTHTETPVAPNLVAFEDSVTFQMPATLPDTEPLLHTKTSIISPVKRKNRDTQVERNEKMLSLVMIIVIFMTVITIGYFLPGTPLVLATLFMGAAIVLTKRVQREQATKMLLVLGVSVATIDYLCWRFVVTNWQGWWISVPLLCAEVLGGLHVLGFQMTVWPWSAPRVEWGIDPTHLPIFIFIPTVNEGASILRPTLEGALVARDTYLKHYPHGDVTIVVCNDGRVAKADNWEETEQLAKELGVTCVTRTVGGGAKAGNIENARQQVHATGNALIVIFDADQVAKPDFLLKTVPPFRDTKMGWVQTGQYYANLNNPISRWADDQQSMFYNLLSPGKAALNAAFICGTNVVMRAAALDQIGGLPQDSVTEDFAASIALHPFWHSVYLTEILATGLGPLDVQSYLKQQGRWAIGTLSVFRTHWRDILLPKKHGLRIEQRVQYFLACTHYLHGLRDFIYVLSPILFIITGIPAVRQATLGEYLWHFVPYFLLSAISLWYAARDITGVRGIVIGFGCFPVLIESLLSVILRRKVGFTVTSKKRRQQRSHRYLWIYVVIFVLCLFSLFLATQKKGLQQTSLFISGMWILYSMVMLGSFFWLNIKDMRFQSAMQKAVSDHETVARHPYASRLLKRKQGLHPLLNVALGILVAAPILGSYIISYTSVFASSATPFVMNQEKMASPYFGVSLPASMLHSQPPILEHDLGTQFSIIGRTQDIVHDHFDKTWANQLAAEHARPWITLQFGVFGANGKPPLDSDLLSIINGVHDQEIRQWAADIRNFDKPVYLTILLQADKNWALTSGVANGGIPEDVSQAWMHVRAIFKQLGANNVAWVWAMADPLHDQQFAPPASAIDAVLQDFINYPGTQWGNPEQVLHQLVHHYPNKPVIVEISTDGSAQQKAAWTAQLSQAVDDTPQVYALLYHEGGPALNASAAQIEGWSLASDPDSLAAMQQLVSNLHSQAVARSY